MIAPDTDPCEGCPDYMSCHGCPVPAARHIGACGVLGDQPEHPAGQPHHHHTAAVLLWIACAVIASGLAGLSAGMAIAFAGR